MTWGYYIRTRDGVGATPVVLILIPIILLGGFFIFPHLRRTARIDNTPSAIATHADARDNLALDSDHDGLKDWEEQIYHTKSNNPDTDGDGTNDGDEITQNRDPLISGPNDVLIKTLPSSTISNQDQPDDTPNLTQKLAEVFGQNYLLGFIQNPNDPHNLDPQNLDTIAEKMTQAALARSQASAMPALTINDITVLRGATKDDMIRYLEQFNQILMSSIGAEGSEEILLKLTAAIVNKNANNDADADLATLKKRIDAYDAFLSRTKSLSVPDQFASLHVQYLNTTVKEREALKKIRAIQTDAMLALVGIRELIQTTKDFMVLQQQYFALERQEKVARTK